MELIDLFLLTLFLILKNNFTHNIIFNKFIIFFKFILFIIHSTVYFSKLKFNVINFQSDFYHIYNLLNFILQIIKFYFLI